MNENPTTFTVMTRARFPFPLCPTCVCRRHQCRVLSIVKYAGVCREVNAGTCIYVCMFICIGHTGYLQAAIVVVIYITIMSCFINLSITAVLSLSPPLPSSVSSAFLQGVWRR